MHYKDQVWNWIVQIKFGFKPNVTVAQPARASYGDHKTGPVVLGARNSDWSRHSPSDYRTSRTRVW